MSRLIGLVPARKGSKGLPGKNFLPVTMMGPSLYEIQTEAARGLCEVVLSTDAEIGYRGDSFRVHKRSTALADDTTPLVTVMRDVAAWLDLDAADAIMLLMPTYALRTRADVQWLVEEWALRDAPALIGVTEPVTHPYLTYSITSDGLEPVVNPDVDRFYRRQDYPRVYALTLFACIARIGVLRRLNSQCFFEESEPIYVPREKCLDIDTAEDLRLAARIIQQRDSR